MRGLSSRSLIYMGRMGGGGSIAPRHQGRAIMDGELRRAEEAFSGKTPRNDEKEYLIQKSYQGEPLKNVRIRRKPLLIQKTLRRFAAGANRPISIAPPQSGRSRALKTHRLCRDRYNIQLEMAPRASP